MLGAFTSKLHLGQVFVTTLQGTGSQLIASHPGNAWRALSSASLGPSVIVGTQTPAPVSHTATIFPEAGLSTESSYNDPLDEPSGVLAGPASARANPPAVPEFQMPPHVLRDLRPPVHPYQLVPKQAQRITLTPALYTPWTPTRALQRRAHISRRMGFLMQVLEREQMERVRRSRPLPDFRAGDVLEVRVMVPEAERRVAVYRGVCIARYHKCLRSTFKIYNVFPECGGVVQHLPLYMPDLLGIKVVGRIPASQERLFYLLERETSDYTFQTGVAASK